MSAAELAALRRRTWFRTIKGYDEELPVFGILVEGEPNAAWKPCRVGWPASFHHLVGKEQEALRIGSPRAFSVLRHQTQ
jgi:hypothetical protein